MILVREVLRCRPGKVREMVNRFTGLSAVTRRLGGNAFRVLTDLSGERFWTVVAEMEAESLDAFLDLEERVMADEEAQKIFAGYHEFVVEGRREVFRIQS